MTHFKRVCTGCFALLFLLLSGNLQAQNDSCGLRISLLTATPGAELYSTFGHSALRVTDSFTNSDIVYNYGTFNFDEPGFYTKFIRGKLLYYLSTEYFESFKYSYQLEERGLTEQVLDLSCDEKIRIARLLRENLLPGNQFYKYDFLFDNCTTRLRDLVEKSADSRVHFGNVLANPQSFRDLIHKYLDKNYKPWSKLGIDILLGARTDAIMSAKEVMFLPDYLMFSFDSSVIDRHPLVATKENLYAVTGIETSNSTFTTPLFIFSCFFLLYLLLSFSKNASVRSILARLDALLFFVTGLLGILLVFMWFGTDHIMTKENYNLLWAIPLHTVFAFFLQSRKNWVRIYFYCTIFLYNILLLSWCFLPQQLNPALLPLIGVLLFRSYLYISKKK